MSKLHWGAFRDANEKEDKWVVSGYSLQFLLSMFFCYYKLECWCLSQHLWMTKIDFIPCLIRMGICGQVFFRQDMKYYAPPPPKKKKMPDYRCYKAVFYVWSVSFQLFEEDFGSWAHSEENFPILWQLWRYVQSMFLPIFLTFASNRDRRVFFFFCLNHVTYKGD